MLNRFVYFVLMAMTQQSLASWQDLVKKAGVDPNIVRRVAEKNLSRQEIFDLHEKAEAVKAANPEDMKAYWDATHADQKHAHVKAHTHADYARKLKDLRSYGMDHQYAQLSAHYLYMKSQLDPSLPKVEKPVHRRPQLPLNEGYLKVVAIQDGRALMKCEKQSSEGSLPLVGVLFPLEIAQIKMQQPLTVDQYLIFREGDLVVLPTPQLTVNRVY